MSNPFNTEVDNQISAILDAVDHSPRIIQCIQAHNEEGLIRECMLQLYDKVDQILVLEGAVTNRPGATEDGHSTDRTVEIIKQVMAEEDPENKFMFIQIDRPWNDLEEMKNAFFQYMRNGDWMLITDVDEFIMPDVVDRLRTAISIEPYATEIVPGGFYHFWRDAWHMRRPSGDWGQQHQRFIRFQEGLHYKTHPVATDRNDICTYFHPIYYARRFVLKDFVVYHYSYCKPGIEEEVKSKAEFYDKELGQDKHGHVGAYARGGQTDEFLNRAENLKDVLVFDGDHPPILHGHPMVTHRDPEFLAAEQQDPEVGFSAGEFDSFLTAAPYSLDDIPLIWVWAAEGKEPYTQLYNTIEVPYVEAAEA